MGRKYTIPYGLYVAHGFVSAHLANQTGFNEEDLKLFGEALRNMFDHDRSAARGIMRFQDLFLFKHSSSLGSTPAHHLFDMIKIEKIDKTKPARKYSEFSVTSKDEIRSKLPNGVELIEMF